jgi:hypothetical protein
MANADVAMPAGDERLQEDADAHSPPAASATEAPALTTMECVLTIGSIGLVVLMGALVGSSQRL